MPAERRLQLAALEAACLGAGPPGLMCTALAAAAAGAAAQAACQPAACPAPAAHQKPMSDAGRLMKLPPVQMCLRSPLEEHVLARQLVRGAHNTALGTC